MKKLILYFIVLAIITSSCQKKIEFQPPATGNDQQIQQKPRCGMEEAMASMPDEWKKEMLALSNKENVVASELLLYLDFDGAVVFRGLPNPTGYSSPIISNTRNCPPPVLTPAQIQQVIEFVEDDYSPFNIKVTTQLEEFNSYTAGFKHICIISTHPSVIGMGSGVNGVAPWPGPRNRAPFNPSFVFASIIGDLDEIATAICHETAHTLGLGHQSVYNEECGFLSEYHYGFGTGPLSFAPHMGIAYNGAITNWWSQPCVLPFTGYTQNDFEYINLHVQLKKDDFPNTASGNLTLAEGEITGILGQAGDVDYILVNFRNPGPVTISSVNADLKVSVCAVGGHVLDEYNDPESTSVTIPSVAGMRYLKIEAASNSNMDAQFMTGKYKVAF